MDIMARVSPTCAVMTGGSGHCTTTDIQYGRLGTRPGYNCSAAAVLTRKYHAQHMALPCNTFQFDSMRRRVLPGPRELIAALVGLLFARLAGFARPPEHAGIHVRPDNGVCIASSTVQYSTVQTMAGRNRTFSE